jgi:cyclic pyranopterin phosphate synthase
VTPREAVASGSIRLSRRSLEAIASRTVRKGDVLEVSRVAAIMAVKRTPLSIPHCHPVPVTAVDVDFNPSNDGITVTCTVRAEYRTGVEMEALSGVTAALLTIWDMVKYLEKDGEGQYPDTVLEDVRVLRKTKGGGA